MYSQNLQKILNGPFFSRKSRNLRRFLKRANNIETHIFFANGNIDREFARECLNPSRQERRMEGSKN